MAGDASGDVDDILDLLRESDEEGSDERSRQDLASPSSQRYVRQVRDGLGHLSFDVRRALEATYSSARRSEDVTNVHGESSEMESERRRNPVEDEDHDLNAPEDLGASQLSGVNLAGDAGSDDDLAWGDEEEEGGTWQGSVEEDASGLRSFLEEVEAEDAAPAAQTVTTSAAVPRSARELPMYPIPDSPAASQPRGVSLGSPMTDPERHTLPLFADGWRRIASELADESFPHALALVPEGGRKALLGDGQGSHSLLGESDVEPASRPVVRTSEAELLRLVNALLRDRSRMASQVSRLAQSREVQSGSKEEARGGIQWWAKRADSLENRLKEATDKLQQVEKNAKQEANAWTKMESAWKETESSLRRRVRELESDARSANDAATAAQARLSSEAAEHLSELEEARAALREEEETSQQLRREVRRFRQLAARLQAQLVRGGAEDAGHRADESHTATSVISTVDNADGSVDDDDNDDAWVDTAFSLVRVRASLQTASRERDQLRDQLEEATAALQREQNRAERAEAQRRAALQDRATTSSEAQKEAVRKAVATEREVWSARVNDLERRLSAEQQTRQQVEERIQAVQKGRQNAQTAADAAKKDAETASAEARDTRRMLAQETSRRKTLDGALEQLDADVRKLRNAVDSAEQETARWRREAEEAKRVAASHSAAAQRAAAQQRALQTAADEARAEAAEIARQLRREKPSPHKVSSRESELQLHLQDVERRLEVAEQRAKDAETRAQEWRATHETSAQTATEREHVLQAKIRRMEHDLTTLRDRWASVLRRTEEQQQRERDVFRSIHQRDPKKASPTDQAGLDLIALFERRREAQERELNQLRTAVSDLTNHLQRKTEGTARVASAPHFREAPLHRRGRRRRGRRHTETLRPARDDSSSSTSSTSSSTRSSPSPPPPPVRRHREDDEEAEDSILREASARVSKAEHARAMQQWEERVRQLEEALASMTMERDARPSVPQWTALQRRLADAERSLEAAAEAGWDVTHGASRAKQLRQEARDRWRRSRPGSLARRDRQAHALGLHVLDSLPRDTAITILTDVCVHLRINDPFAVPEAVEHIVSAVRALPPIEAFVQDVCATVGVRIGKPAQREEALGEALRRLGVMRNEARAAMRLRQLRRRIEAVMVQQREQGSEEKEGETGPTDSLSDEELVDGVESICQLVQRAGFHGSTFQAAEKALDSGDPRDVIVAAVQQYQKLFGVRSLDGLFPSMASIHQRLESHKNAWNAVCEALGVPRGSSPQQVIAAIRHGGSHQRNPADEGGPEESGPVVRYTNPSDHASQGEPHRVRIGLDPLEG